MADWSWDDVKDRATPRTETVDICLDGTAYQQLADLRRELAEVRDSSDSLDAGTADLQRQVEQLEQQTQEATVTFDVSACGHRRWRELIVAHPSDEPGQRFDLDTFLPAAIAECVDQFDKPEQVVDAADRLSHGQIVKLFTAVLKVNEGDDRVPTMRGR